MKTEKRSKWRKRWKGSVHSKTKRKRRKEKKRSKKGKHCRKNKQKQRDTEREDKWGGRERRQKQKHEHKTANQGKNGLHFHIHDITDRTSGFNTQHAAATDLLLNVNLQIYSNCQINMSEGNVSQKCESSSRILNQLKRRRSIYFKNKAHLFFIIHISSMLIWHCWLPASSLSWRICLNPLTSQYGAQSTSHVNVTAVENPTFIFILSSIW